VWHGSGGSGGTGVTTRACNSYNTQKNKAALVLLCSFSVRIAAVGSRVARGVRAGRVQTPRQGGSGTPLGTACTPRLAAPTPTRPTRRHASDRAPPRRSPTAARAAAPARTDGQQTRRRRRGRARNRGDVRHCHVAPRRGWRGGGHAPPHPRWDGIVSRAGVGCRVWVSGGTRRPARTRRRDIPLDRCGRVCAAPHIFVALVVATQCRTNAATPWVAPRPRPRKSGTKWGPRPAKENKQNKAQAQACPSRHQPHHGDHPGWWQRPLVPAEYEHAAWVATRASVMQGAAAADLPGQSLVPPTRTQCRSAPDA